MMVCSDIVDKKKLEKHKSRRREFCKLEEAITNIDNVLKSPAGIKYSDMPRSQKPFDKVGNLLSVKLEKEKRQKKLARIICEEQAIIESILDKMLNMPESPRGPMNTELRDVLRYFYIFDFNWEEILKIFCLGSDEFNDNHDSNIRKLHRWHGWALSKFIKCQMR